MEKNIQGNLSCFKYKQYATKVSIYDTPVAPLVVFNWARVVIPKVMRSDTLNCLHEYHFLAIAMIAAAEIHCWWPRINSQTTGKLTNCLTCQQL